MSIASLRIVDLTQSLGTIGATVKSAEAQWRYFFWVGIPSVSIAVSLLAQQSSLAATLLIATAVAASALSGMALYRTLWPLCAPEPPASPRMSGGRTVAALGREKALVLRSIKELEFDRNMGKVSEADFDIMSTRLRTRATRLMRDLEAAPRGYRSAIEKELAHRLDEATTVTMIPTTAQAAPSDRPSERVESSSNKPVAARIVAPERGRRDRDGEARRACLECTTANDRDARFCKQCGNALQPLCVRCDTVNDADARFCKQCGAPLGAVSE